MDLYSNLVEAEQRLVALVSSIEADSYSSPTPCDRWDVRALGSDRRACRQQVRFRGTGDARCVGRRRVGACRDCRRGLAAARMLCALGIEDGGRDDERGRDCQPAAPAVGQHAFAHEQHFSVSCATRVATFAIDWLQTRVVRTGQAVHAHRQPAAVGGEMEEWSVRQPLMKMVSSSAARTSRPLRRNSSASDTPSGCQPLAAR